MTETRHRSTGLASSCRYRLHRPPRAYPAPVPVGEIVIAPPPRSGRSGAAGVRGWPLLLLPLLGGAGSLPLLLGSPLAGRRRLLLGLAASLLLSGGAGLAMRLWARHAAGRTRHRERVRYLAHLQDVAGELARVQAIQRTAAEHLHPDLTELLALVDRGERVWERTAADEDFLEVRIGRGPLPLAAPVRLDLGRDPLADHDPELLAAAEDLARRGSRLEGAPVVISLRRLGVLTVRGRTGPARALARSVLLRLAACHAPGDLRILAAFSPDAAAAWDWLKWLPHARDELDDGPGVAVPRCLLAATARQAVALLEREVRPRLTGSEPGAGSASAGPPHAGVSGPPAGAAHLVVVIDGYSPGGRLGRLPLLDELMRSAAALDATVVCLVDSAADEPSATAVRVEPDGHGGLVASGVRQGGRTIEQVRADAADLAVSGAIARRLAPLWLDRPGYPGGTSPPGRSRLLDLLGVPDADDIDFAMAWRPRPGSDLLRVPVGVPVGVPAHGQVPAWPAAPAAPAAGRPVSPRGPTVPAAGAAVVLDLKEAAEGGMGPHGLLIGATGSGKSELLRTIVMGLALTHPPELLAFVLVDFKGGAAFAGLAGLPHTAGLITNLQTELTLVDRAEAALRGEQERRQRLLRDAGNLNTVAEYQRLRVADPRLEPLPRLLLVVDEFSELLAARPDFLDLFTTVGRTGRSLGMHLLLASQRLEEGRLRGLESHLRYRICLRTFSPAESFAVLGTAGAYLLPPSPGAGLLKVDSGACQRFRGALVSSTPVDNGARRATVPTVLPFDPLVERERVVTSNRGRRPGGQVPGGGEPGRGEPGRGEPDPPGVDGPAGRTDMEAVVVAMTSAIPAGRQVRPVWLPPLPPTVTLAQVLERVPGPVGCARRPGDPGWLQVPAGIVDRPLEQVQEPLLLDFAGQLGHLAIAGAPRSGKSTLLATLVAALALTHPPDAVQVYGIDLGGGLLHELTCLPHVGGVCGGHEPARAGCLVRELRALIAAREQMLRRHGPGPMAAWHARRCGGPGLDGDGYGEVFLMVDNWSRLRRELADLEPEIEALAATGLHYGVHLVVAANRWADLRLALRDNLGGRLELRLNDPVESQVGRSVAGRLSERLPGRGLTLAGHELQVALPVLAATTGEGERTGGRALDAGEIARRAVRSPTGSQAPPLRPLPTLVRISDLPETVPPPDQGSPRGVAFALREQRLEPAWLDLLSAPHFLVLGDAECGKTGTLRCLALRLGARYPPEELQLVVVDYRRTLVDLAGAPHCCGYACSPATATQLIGRLRALLEGRLPPAVAAPPDPLAALSPDAPPALAPGSPPALSPGAPPGAGWAELVRSWRWTGPRYLLVVDDYDLVATSVGNPLEPLLDLVSLGRDLGLHVLLARPVSGAARSSFEPVYQRLRETGSPGLIMSGDPQEGSLLGGRAAAPQPPGRGYLVGRRGQSALVQVAWAPPGTATALDRAPSRPP